MRDRWLVGGGRTRGAVTVEARGDDQVVVLQNLLIGRTAVLPRLVKVNQGNVGVDVEGLVGCVVCACLVAGTAKRERERERERDTEQQNVRATLQLAVKLYL